MGTNLTQAEEESIQGWVGPCFRKLRLIAEGDTSVTFTPDEAQFLRHTLDTVEHLAHYGEGYSRWKCRAVVAKGKAQDLDLHVEMP